MSKELNEGKSVDVELVPEPTNPVDSSAIAFMCTIDNKRQKLGYVVSEATSAAHSALANDQFICAKVAWSRFLIHWSRSGPGWYAGIAITKAGVWPTHVVQCRSSV